MKSHWDVDEERQRTLDVLVIDSGAIIKGHGRNFHTIANRFVTVDEVVAEIRDSKSRDLLLKLPFELEIHNPSDEAMAAVAKFAEKSGDFAALSLTDLKVMALAYTFEINLSDKSHIREEPVDNKTLQWRQQQQQRGASMTTLNVKKPASAVSSLPKKFPLDMGDGSEGHRGGQNDEVKVIEGQDTLSDDEEEDTPRHEVEDEYDDGYGDYYGEEEEEEEASQEPFLLENIEENFPSLGLDGFQALDENLQKTSRGEGTEARRETPMAWGRGCFTEPTKGDADENISVTPKAGAKLDEGRTFNAAAYLGRKEEEKASRGEIGLGSAGNTSVTGSGGASVRKDQSSSTSRILSGASSSGASSMSQVRAAFDDDGVGWINSSNIQECLVTGQGMIGSNVLRVSEQRNDEFVSANKKDKKKARNAKIVSGKCNESSKEEAPHRVGCVTTDFTMQNVLLQMNLHVVNVDGMHIRSVKQWVLRCMACFTIHYDMDRLFCSKCGVNHMSRVACSIDSKTGTLRLHLKKGFMASRRGKQHCLPLPGKQGRFQGELLLREDQLLTGIWRQKVVKMQKDVKSAFGHDITSDVGLHINKTQAIRVGLGRANPNADKGRERRGAKKKKNRR